MLNWIAEHFDSIFQWIGVIVTACTGIVKLTPTKKDDGIMGTIVKIADYASIVNTKANKEKLEKLVGKK